MDRRADGSLRALNVLSVLFQVAVLVAVLISARYYTAFALFVLGPPVVFTWLCKFLAPMVFPNVFVQHGKRAFWLCLIAACAEATILVICLLAPVIGGHPLLAVGVIYPAAAAILNGRMLVFGGEGEGAMGIGGKVVVSVLLGVTLLAAAAVWSEMVGLFLGFPRFWFWRSMAQYAGSFPRLPG